VSEKPLSVFHVQQLQEAVDELLKLCPLLQQIEIKNSVVQMIKSNYVAHNSISEPENQHPTVFYSLDADAIYKPKICPESNGLDLPLQSDIHFEANDLKKIDLKIKFKLPQHYSALLLNKHRFHNVRFNRCRFPKQRLHGSPKYVTKTAYFICRNSISTTICT
jgi:hypothetical protein